MQEESIVRDIEVSDGKQVHKASYFVEFGVLHAQIGDKVIRTVIGADTSDEAVRRLLLGHIQTRTWRRRMSEKWRDRSSTTDPSSAVEMRPEHENGHR